MKKRYRLKRGATIIISVFIILIIALVIFVISILKTKSYSIEYSVDDYKISEYYNDEEKLFYYEINKDDITYSFIYSSKYIKERKLIDSIKTSKEEDEVCLLISSKYISTYPLCSKGKNLIDYHLINKNIIKDLNYTLEYEDSINEKYKNYNIFNDNLDIYIWNYKGFNHISNNKIKFINIFNKDIYEIPLATKINEYILIPDYEQKYTFSNIYILNLKTDEVEKWKLSTSISFDSYVLGTNDKSVYIVDQKNKKEFELVPHKQKMRTLATKNKQGILINNGEEKKISMKSLTAKQMSFIYRKEYNYKLNEDELFLTYLDKNKQIKIADNVSSIIYTKEDNVYYLVDTTLYRYNLFYGSTKLAEYSEWAFNNKNVIFIND